MAVSLNSRTTPCMALSQQVGQPVLLKDQTAWACIKQVIHFFFQDLETPEIKEVPPSPGEGAGEQCAQKGN